MRNCLIMGSGRSGTSMVAGTLSKAGYNMGEQLMGPTPANPKGYYESVEVEAINEDLLAPVVPARPGGVFGKFFRHRPRRFQRWLARVPVHTPIPCPEAVAARIRRVTEKQPFCFKDPRFCYTLPAWRANLQDAVFVCVFRQPAATAESILKNWRDEPYLHDLTMTYERAVEIWTLMYRHVLETHRAQGSWLFLHYNQVLTADGLDRIAQFVGAPVDREFPDKALRRSTSQHAVPANARAVYRQLCDLAEYSERA